VCFHELVPMFVKLELRLNKIPIWHGLILKVYPFLAHSLIGRLNSCWTSLQHSLFEHLFNLYCNDIDHNIVNRISISKTGCVQIENTPFSLQPVLIYIILLSYFTGIPCLSNAFMFSISSLIKNMLWKLDFYFKRVIWQPASTRDDPK